MDYGLTSMGRGLLYPADFTSSYIQQIMEEKLLSEGVGDDQESLRGCLRS